MGDITVWVSPCETVRLYRADCREVARMLADGGERVASIITDPPYGLTFMGKGWDRHTPGRAFWEVFLELASPGAHLLAFGGTRTYHRQTCAIEDAGWIIRDCLMWLYGCHSDDTECLTRRGWLAHGDITEDDEVMQWDASTGALSWTKPERVLRFHYRGRMINLRNRHTNQLLTPNHRVYARVRRDCRKPRPFGFEVMRAGLIKGHWLLDLPMAGMLSEGDMQMTPDDAYLLGWWLTDAWPHGDGKACMFSQSKPATLAKLRAALAPYSPSEYIKKPRKQNHNIEHTFYLTGPKAQWLLGGWPKRRLGWWALDLPLESRMALFRGLMDGDGSQPEGQTAHTFWSKNQERRDVFMAMCLSMDIRCHEDGTKGCVYLNSKTQTTQLQSRHRKSAPPVQYDAIVWCLQVPTGAFVVRRDGRPFISGNSGFPKSLQIDKAIDRHLGAEREVVGRKRLQGNPQFVLADNGGINTPGRTHADITTPATPQAARWEGWGTAAKPAYEPICLAMKPIEGSFARNALEHGVAGLWIDGARIEIIGERGWNVPEPAPAQNPARLASANNTPSEGRDPSGRRGTPHNKGRWPANVILGEEAAVMLDEQAGELGSGGRSPGVDNAGIGYKGSKPVAPRRGFTKDTGGASRFFYTAKASREERRAGLHGGLEAIHPSVKPLSLMKWLCRLTKQPDGGTVFDPFMGSGSTGVAAVLEGRPFIGCELEPEYFEISKARIIHALRGVGQRVEDEPEGADTEGQLDLWGR